MPLLRIRIIVDYLVDTEYFILYENNSEGELPNLLSEWNAVFNILYLADLDNIYWIWQLLNNIATLKNRIRTMLLLTA